MIIGLILLGFLLVGIVFGFAQKTLDRMLFPTTAVIVVLLAIAIGAFLPTISIGTRFSMSIGGFVIPVLVALFAMFSLGFRREMVYCDFAILATAAVSFGMLMLVPVDYAWARLLSGISLGIVCGSVAYLISQSRKGALASSILGFTIGHIIYFLIGRYAYGWNISLDLGVGFLFDALILSALWSVLLAEIVETLKERSYVSHRQSTSFEAGLDYFEDDDFSDD